VAKLIYDKPSKPTLKMEYVICIIRGCGGDQRPTVAPSSSNTTRRPESGDQQVMAGEDDRT
jgi:hypothetical protein